MQKQESHTWHKAWGEFKKDLQKISKNEVLYHHAIDDFKKSPWEFTQGQKTLLSHFNLEKISNTPAFKNPVHSNQTRTSKPFFDTRKIMDALIAEPIETYRSILGEPKKTTSKEMRYSQGLVVSLKGAKAGFWYDFSEGVGGNPIQAIMREKSVTFSEAIKEGASIARISGVATTLPTIKAGKTKKMEMSEEEKNKILSAKSIVKGGVPIRGTLAEKYLKEHRGIEHPEKLNVLFWPKGALWKATDDNEKLYDKINKIPALLIAATNDKGDITGVQRIYLDEKTGGKNTFMSHAKLSKGRIEASAGVLQRSGKSGTLYLAEGPETGASIAMANPKATVLVSFGLSNLKNLSSLIKGFHPREVIIAADNDSLSKNNTLKITKAAQMSLQENGVTARIVAPKNIDGNQKTDWNDVHKQQGLNEVKQQLLLDITSREIHKAAIQINNEKTRSLVQYVNEFEHIQRKSCDNYSHVIADKNPLKHGESNLGDSRFAVQKSSTIEPIKQMERNQKTMDIEL